MELGDPADLGARLVVDRHHRFESQLNVPPGPEDSWIHGAGGRPSAAVDGRAQCEFDDRNHLIERLAQSNILYERLQIRKAVFDGEAPFDGVRMALDVNVALGGDRSVACPAWNTEAHRPGQCKR